MFSIEVQATNVFAAMPGLQSERPLVERDEFNAAPDERGNRRERRITESSAAARSGAGGDGPSRGDSEDRAGGGRFSSSTVSSRAAERGKCGRGLRMAGRGFRRRRRTRGEKRCGAARPRLAAMALLAGLSSPVDGVAGISATAPSACDESKCRATRAHPWVEGETEWTCWAPVDESAEGANVTNLCEEGLEGRIVEDVPQEEIEGTLRAWITCCPPGEMPLEGNVTQQCSDRACSSPDWEGGGNCWADGFQEPMSCSNTLYRYPRYTGLMSMIYLQYVCCTSPSHSDNVMQELLVARVIWIVLSSITFLVCLVFILAIVSDKGTRAQGYNLYLVFLAIPDALANLFIVVRNSLTITGTPVSPVVHIFLASTEYFYAAANMWLNGLIVRQIHRVLLKSNRFVKVPPPSVSTVRKQAAGTYAFASGWFAWAFFLYYRGLVVFSLDQVVNVWIVTRVLMVAPPLCYVIYVCVDVWRRKLLPRSGRTRVLSLYFLRVVMVFLVTWVPYFIIYEIAWNVTHSRWMVHVSYYLGSIQGFISVVVALSKPDIRRAVLRFVSCGRKNKPDPRPTTNRFVRKSPTAAAAPESRTTEVTESRTATSAEDTWHNDEVGTEVNKNHHLRTSARSSIFHQSQNEWTMEDVWGNSRPIHGILDEAEEYQAESAAAEAAAAARDCVEITVWDDNDENHKVSEEGDTSAGGGLSRGG